MTTKQSTETVNVDTYMDYTITARNPFGFWDIHNADRGVLPKDLRGVFTTLVDAKTAIDAYHRGKEQDITNAALKHMEKVKAEAKAKAEAKEKEKAIMDKVAELEAKAKEIEEKQLELDLDDKKKKTNKK